MKKIGFLWTGSVLVLSFSLLVSSFLICGRSAKAELMGDIGGVSGTSVFASARVIVLHQAILAGFTHLSTANGEQTSIEIQTVQMYLQDIRMWTVAANGQMRMTIDSPGPVIANNGLIHLKSIAGNPVLMGVPFPYVKIDPKSPVRDLIKMFSPKALVGEITQENIGSNELRIHNDLPSQIALPGLDGAPDPIMFPNPLASGETITVYNPIDIDENTIEDLPDNWLPDGLFPPDVTMDTVLPDEVELPGTLVFRNIILDNAILDVQSLRASSFFIPRGRLGAERNY